MTNYSGGTGLGRSDFLALHDGNHQAIYRYFARRFGVAIAEELTATTFAEAWASRRRYDPTQANPKTWLWAVATKLGSKHARTEARRFRALAKVAPEPSTPDFTHEIDRRVDAETRWNEVAHQIAALESRDRDVLFLFAWSDLSYEEMSTTLQVPIGTVKSRLNRARARMAGPAGKAVS